MTSILSKSELQWHVYMTNSLLLLEKNGCSRYTNDELSPSIPNISLETNALNRAAHFIR